MSHTLLAAGILDNNASTTADLMLFAYLLFFLPAMLVGFIFARRKMFEPYHKFVMTSITLINWVLIIFVMAVSYVDSVVDYVPDNLDDSLYLLPTIHLITGAIAQLLATYLIILMWFEDELPQWFITRKIKRYMRLTLALWVITALLGISIYLRWYTDTLGDIDSGGAPLATPEPSDPEGEIPLATPEVSPEPSDNGTAEPGGTPEPGVTAEPGDASGQGGTAEPVDTPEPAMEGTPGSTPEPAAETTPEPGDMSSQNNTDEPADTPEPAAEDTPGRTPEPGAAMTPEPGDIAGPGGTAEPADTPEPSDDDFDDDRDEREVDDDEPDEPDDRDERDDDDNDDKIEADDDD